MFCFHDRLKEFTFKDGTHIKCCPDCTQFDTKRRDALRTGHVEMPKAKEQLHFDLLLEKIGLDVDNDGLDWWLNGVGDSSACDLLNQLMVLKRRGIVNLSPEMLTILGEGVRLLLKIVHESKRKVATALDDQEWNDRQRPFFHTQSMPRHFNAYCAHCIDVVVNNSHNKVRTQKGVYLPIEHDCASVRVYNLQGTLIEVMAI